MTSPCAMLMTPIKPKVMASPSAAMSSTDARPRPLAGRADDAAGRMWFSMLVTVAPRPAMVSSLNLAVLFRGTWSCLRNSRELMECIAPSALMAAMRWRNLRCQGGSTGWFLFKARDDFRSVSVLRRFSKWGEVIRVLVPPICDRIAAHGGQGIGDGEQIEWQSLMALRSLELLSAGVI